MIVGRNDTILSSSLPLFLVSRTPPPISNISHSFHSMRDKSLLVKVLKIAALAYISFSLLYATAHLLGIKKSDSSNGQLLPRSTKRVEPLTVSQLQERYNGNQQVGWSSGSGKSVCVVICYSIWILMICIGTNSQKEFISEDLMLEKVFADAMGPSKVIPYLSLIHI